jgi:hypothetical protein
MTVGIEVTWGAKGRENSPQVIFIPKIFVFGYQIEEGQISNRNVYVYQLMHIFISLREH